MADLTQNPRPLLTAWGRIDKVALTGALILLTVAIFDRPAVVPTIEETLEHFWGTLPYILFAVVAIAWMKASGSERLLDGAFKGRETRMILIGALVGGLSPFCSCQVIPFVAALLAAGAPLSAVMAFWLSSPLMDPAMFAITAGGLGFDFAVAKTVAAVLLGIAGGYTVKLMAATPVFADPLKAQMSTGRLLRREEAEPELAVLAGGRPSPHLPRKRLVEPCVPGQMAAAGLSPPGAADRLCPGRTGGDRHRRRRCGADPAGHRCGRACLPQRLCRDPAAGGLIGQGMNPGAAMAFVIAGGISSIPAAVAVWALVKPRVFAAYITFALIGAFAAGLTWSAIA
jgi:uncharacterized membrane protein YraQ (UPF0718 family)